MNDCDVYEHMHDEPNQIIPCQCGLRSLIVRDGTMCLHGEVIGYDPMCGFTVFKKGFSGDLTPIASA